MRPITANSLSIVEVRSPAGEHIGKIVDFMLDTEQRTVVYAVLAVGGVLGVGAKMLAVPPESLKLAPDARTLEITAATEALEVAPGIDRAKPPEHANAALADPTTRTPSHSSPTNQR